MNMLTRYYILLWLLKQQKLNNIPAPPVNDTIISEYRVLPYDMGWRKHLPNYRYLSFIELNVTKWLKQQSKERMGWVISAQQLTYLREIMLWDKMTVKSQVLGWSEKYVYFRHEFFVKHQLMAISLTKFVLVAKGMKVLPTSKIFDTSEQMHPVITSWLANQQDIKQMTKTTL